MHAVQPPTELRLFRREISYVDIISSPPRSPLAILAKFCKLWWVVCTTSKRGSEANKKASITQSSHCNCKQLRTIHTARRSADFVALLAASNENSRRIEKMWRTHWWLAFHSDVLHIPDFSHSAECEGRSSEFGIILSVVVFLFKRFALILCFLILV